MPRFLHRNSNMDLFLSGSLTEIRLLYKVIHGIKVSSFFKNTHTYRHVWQGAG